MRKPPNFTDEIAAAKARVEKLERDAEAKLGKLVIATGARDLPVEILAGALLDLVGRHRDDPSSLGRLAESGAAFFRDPAARRRGNGRAAPPTSAPSPARPDAYTTPASFRPAEAG